MAGNGHSVSVVASNLSGLVRSGGGCFCFVADEKGITRAADNGGSKR